ncbi:hypothetical protein EBZ80_22075, partial [bacterium]|nr:hypothetical protein [bacterium]
MSLLKNIQKIVDGTVDAFIVDIAAKYDLSEDDLREMWNAASKTKPKKTRAGSGRKTGYQLFSAEIREELRREDPAMPFGMISKTISLRWKACDTKDEYNARARRSNTVAEPASPTVSSPTASPVLPSSAVGSASPTVSSP